MVPDALRLLSDLVARPSVNPMGQTTGAPEFGERAVTEYLEQFFRSIRVDCNRQQVLADRENIIARYIAPSARRTVLLEVHQDTVPADGMADPFVPRVADGRLHGRGACDVKGGLAAILVTLARITTARPAHTNVTVACTVDEEHLGLGVRRLVEDGASADVAIVAEPTGLDIVNCHKGLVRWHVCTGGRACHSSEPDQGVNAIHRMAAVLIAIEQFSEWLRISPSQGPLGPPTLNVGRISGGSSVNTVPDWCRIEIDRRLVPGEDSDMARVQLADYIQKTVPFPVQMGEPWTSWPPLAADGSADLVRRLEPIIDSVAGGHQVRSVPFGTDASTLALADIPSIVFGPGDIAQAHTTDEWVALDQVEKAAQILFRFASEE